MELLSKVHKRLDGLVEMLAQKSPWFYYMLHNFKGTQHGSLRSKYEVPERKASGRNVLIFTNRYWLIHAATDMAFAKEFQREGYNVTIVGCDQFIKTCDNDWYGQLEIEKPVNQQQNYSIKSQEK